jgi:hypothetical protein
VLLAAFADEGDEQVGDGRVHLSWPAAA